MQADIDAEADSAAGVPQHAVELALDAPVAGYGKSILMPFEAAFVPDVDVAAGKVVIALDAWLEGQVEVEAAL